MNVNRRIERCERDAYTAHTRAAASSEPSIVRLSGALFSSPTLTLLTLLAPKRPIPHISRQQEHPFDYIKRSALGCCCRGNGNSSYVDSFRLSRFCIENLMKTKFSLPSYVMKTEKAPLFRLIQNTHSNGCRAAEQNREEQTDLRQLAARQMGFNGSAEREKL